MRNSFTQNILKCPCGWLMEMYTVIGFAKSACIKWTKKEGEANASPISYFFGIFSFCPTFRTTFFRPLSSAISG